MALFNSNITAAAATAATVVPVVTPGLVAGDDVLAASMALTTPTPVTVPGMVRPYLAHQGAAHIAINDSIARFGCALLGDDMGMGKTQVLVGLIAERLVKGGYALMFAPSMALAGYRSDLAAAFPSLRLAHLYGRTADLASLPAADIYFISDDAQSMQAWTTNVTVENRGGKSVKVYTANSLVRNAAIITRDELHRDKGSEGKASGLRTKVMMAVGEAARAAGIPIIGATGTLLTNRPVEALVPLQILGGADLVKAVTPGSKAVSGFLWRYCAPQSNGFGTKFGVTMSRMPELHDLLRRTVYIRREKSDLGEALPHSGWIVKPIALNGVLTRYRRIEREFLDLVREEDGPEAMWRKARAETITRMTAMWQEAGAAKAAASVEYIADLVAQGRKVVTFYYHQAVRDGLLNGLAKAGISYTVIDGSVTGAAREMSVDDFQNGTAQVMVAQIKAAGMAVTLTAAADAVFVQVPWSAGDLKQAADRILRVDDRTMARALNGERITWHVLQAAHADGAPTFDMAMWSVLETKAKVCDAVNAGREVTMSDDSVMQQALEAWYPQAQRH